MYILVNAGKDILMRKKNEKCGSLTGICKPFIQLAKSLNGIKNS